MPAAIREKAVVHLRQALESFSVCANGFVCCGLPGCACQLWCRETKDRLWRRKPVIFWRPSGFVPRKTGFRF